MFNDGNLCNKKKYCFQYIMGPTGPTGPQGIQGEVRPTGPTALSIMPIFMH